MEKTILFDIGNVLLFFDFHRALTRLGIPDPNKDQALMEKFYTLRDRVEMGGIAPAVFIAELGQLLDFKGTASELVDAYSDIFMPNDPMWKIVRETKGKCRRILFSNTSAIHIDYIFARYPEFSLFDDAVYSFKVGGSKPTPAMYLDAVERLKIDPAHTFYIDDVLENIAEGERHGFTTHHYQPSSHCALESELARFLAK